MHKKIMNDESNRKKLEQRYMQLQYLAEHMKALQVQHQQLQMQIKELEQTNEALSEFSNVKSGSEVLVPVAGGIFTKATLGEVSELIVNIGGKTAITKSIPDVQAMLTIQIQEIRAAEIELTKQLETLGVQAGAIEAELGEANK